MKRQPYKTLEVIVEAQQANSGSHGPQMNRGKKGISVNQQNLSAYSIRQVLSTLSN
jgi:hypothetical protein